LWFITLVGEEIFVSKKNVIKGNNRIQVNLNKAIPSGIYMYQVKSESLSNPYIIGSGKLVKYLCGITYLEIVKC
jgi:hypothetical protein